jgi:hypothetical protein
MIATGWSVRLANAHVVVVGLTPGARGVVEACAGLHDEGLEGCGVGPVIGPVGRYDDQECTAWREGSFALPLPLIVSNY